MHMNYKKSDCINSA